ncbi:MAG: type II toxin-antitoxin system RelE family toxin [Bacteroidales bacterium]
MKVLYENSFLRDIKKINNKNIKEQLFQTIENIKVAKGFSSLKNVVKLKGHSSAYRLKIGKYRLGFFYENDYITLSRFLHRKDIYKKFP